MTNHWIDYQHSDVIMNIGGNTAENHPISMKWIEKARQTKGAKLMVVDPRFTRTAAVADLFVPIRPGTNIAFLGWLINYVLENKRYHEEYVRHYTNATYLVNPDFGFDPETGLFTGIEDDPGRNAKKYNRDSWQYQKDSEGNVLKDPDMENPHCVLQILKRFYQSYDLATVSKVTGCPEKVLVEAAEMYSSTGQPGKAGNILYAMGITQFTHGSQNVRATALLQLLLGNIGIPGGGVNAQRGQSNVQGSTDMAILYHIIPGYIGAPKAALHPTLADYNQKETPASGYWANKPKFLASMLTAFYPGIDLEQAYHYLPKLDSRDHSHIGMYKYMGQGEVEGMICWADNPAVTGPSAAAKRNYQSALKWIVSVDIFENETAAFWKAPGMNPAEIDTEVFLLPASSAYEKEGTIANSGRWIQWRYQAQKPPGEARTDLWIADKMFKAIQEEYRNNPGPYPDPIVKMNWDYGEEADPNLVAMEINGYNISDGSLVGNFTQLKDDGSTACGNWVYSGYYNSKANPACKSRIRENEGLGLHPQWAFAWPLNRRIVYNRCASDPSGKPWNPGLPLIWWEDGEWKRNDVPDFGWKSPDGEQIPPEVSAEKPFIMLPEGQGRLFAAGTAMADGPLPVHLEPAESPVPNLLHPKATFNPISQRWYDNHLAEAGDPKYPYIITTYRVTEHYQSGALTRNIPWLNELMPELFIELSKELARELGIDNGDTVVIETKRNEITAKACVTARLKPFQINGELKHMVGMPFHWGFAGLAKGAITNDLSPSIGDANTSIPEYKAFLCNIRKVM